MNALKGPSVPVAAIFLLLLDGLGIAYATDDQTRASSQPLGFAQVSDDLMLSPNHDEVLQDFLEHGFELDNSLPSQEIPRIDPDALSPSRSGEFQDGLHQRPGVSQVQTFNIQRIRNEWLRSLPSNTTATLPIGRVLMELQSEALQQSVTDGIDYFEPGTGEQNQFLADIEAALTDPGSALIYRRRFPFFIGADQTLSSFAGLGGQQLNEMNIFRVVGRPSAVPGFDIQRDAIGGSTISIAVDPNNSDRDISIEPTSQLISTRLGAFSGVGILTSRDSIEFDDGVFRFDSDAIRFDGHLSISQEGEALPICERDLEGNPVTSIMTAFQGAPRYVGRSCSGFLAIDDQTFVTARHCLLTEHQSQQLYSTGSSQCISNTASGREELQDMPLDAEYLSGLAVIFGFKVDELGEFPTEFNEDQVRFIEAVSDAPIPADMVLVRLDESVPDSVATPIPIETSPISEMLEQGDRYLAHVGHSLGLPMVLDFENVGIVGAPSGDNASFYVGADSYSGGSGGPVLDLESQTALGILVCGKRDYDAISVRSTTGTECLLPRVTQSPEDSVQQFLHLHSVLQ